MKNVSTVVSLQKPSNQKKIIRKKEIDKYVASINNTQYNMSVEYYTGTKTVKEFSIGFTLKEMHINDDKKTQLKTSDKNQSAFSIFYNFVNYSKYDLTSLESVKGQKISFYKNVKEYFYGNSGTNTIKVNLKSSKVAEVYMLLVNIQNQIKENENMLETLKNNKKSYPFDTDLQKAIDIQLEQRKQLKLQFIDLIKNTIKRYF